MFYEFSCTSCNHTFESNIGEMSTKVITNFPCVKCDKKTMIVNNMIKPINQPTKSTSAIIVADSNRLGDRGFKNTPREFKDLLAKIKSENPGSTIKDRR